MKYPNVVIKKYTPIKSNEIEIDERRLVDVRDFEVCKGVALAGNNIMAIRAGDEFVNKGYVLSPDHDWVLVEDSSQCVVLVPLKKEVSND